MMSAWNTDSGVSIHAELIGKEWVKMGHELKVFSFIREDFHGDGFTNKKDEDYVVRCFGTSMKTNYLDPRPIVSSDYDVFVVQDLRVLPVENLSKIFPVIKKRAKAVVHVLHENHLPEEPWFYQFDWDAVVYFDKRQDFIKRIYKNSYYIPFPCAPPRKGEKEQARKTLKLPLDKKILLIFTQRGYAPYLPDLPDSFLKDTLFLILGRKGEVADLLETYSKSPNILVKEEEVLPWDEFDKYAFASDAIMFHKFRSRQHAVVSTTVFQLLGTGRPLLVPKHSDFFHPLKREVLKYGDHIELGRLVVDVFKGEERVRKSLDAAEKYVKKYSAKKIALNFIRLFKNIC
jgi:predicted nucleotidyltransferase